MNKSSHGINTRPVSIADFHSRKNGLSLKRTARATMKAGRSVLHPVMVFTYTTAIKAVRMCKPNSKENLPPPRRSRLALLVDSHSESVFEVPIRHRQQRLRRGRNCEA